MASAELTRATTTVFSNGRRVSFRRSTKIYRQACRDGVKSTNGRYTGPAYTWIGSLNDVTTIQYSGKSTTAAHVSSAAENTTASHAGSAVGDRRTGHTCAILGR